MPGVGTGADNRPPSASDIPAAGTAPLQHTTPPSHPASDIPAAGPLQQPHGPATLPQTYQQRVLCSSHTAQPPCLRHTSSSHTAQPPCLRHTSSGSSAAATPPSHPPQTYQQQQRVLCSSHTAQPPCLRHTSSGSSAAGHTAQPPCLRHTSSGSSAAATRPSHPASDIPAAGPLQQPHGPATLPQTYQQRVLCSSHTAQPPCLRHTSSGSSAAATRPSHPCLRHTSSGSSAAATRPSHPASDIPAAGPLQQPHGPATLPQTYQQRVLCSSHTAQPPCLRYTSSGSSAAATRPSHPASERVLCRHTSSGSSAAATRPSHPASDIPAAGPVGQRVGGDERTGLLPEQPRLAMQTTAGGERHVIPRSPVPWRTG